MRFRLLSGIGLTLVLALMISASGFGTTARTGAAPKPYRGGSITVDMASADSWPTLDPASAAGQPNSNQLIYEAIYGQLFKESYKHQIEPDLGLSMAISANNTVITIKLRKGVTFQDGTPFNAAAVAWNLGRYNNPATGFPLRAFLPLKSVSAPDGGKGYIVRLTLSAPSTVAESVLTTTAWGYMASPKAVQSEGTSFGTNPVGAGPFEVASNIPSSQLVVKRNPHYWDAPKPYLDSVTFIDSSGGPAALSGLEGNTTQLVYGSGLGVTDILNAAKQPGIRVAGTARLQWMFINMNEAKPPFNSTLAREALFYATNPATIGQALTFGYYTPTQVLEANGESPNIGSKVANFPAYDPAKAKAIVQQLGGLSFTLLPDNATPLYIAFAEALKSQWAAVGIDATIDVESKAAVSADHVSGNFQGTVSLYGNYLPAVLGLIKQTACGSGYSFCDPANDALLNQLSAASTPSQQSALLTKIQQELDSNYRLVPLFAVPNFNVYSSKLHGIPSTWWEYLDGAWLSN